MKKINIVHLGVGRVGQELMNQVIKSKNQLKSLGLEFQYCGFGTRTDGYYYPGGYNGKPHNFQNESYKMPVQNILKKIRKPYVLIDTTASDITYDYWIKTLGNGGVIVSSNKKPLTRSQSDFDALIKHGHKRIRFETTVGAALPIINTLINLLESGDEIIEILGCFSGTLGFICSALEDGMKYSEAVRKAHDLGFTEPDPRDDLSGLDVARKALILSRIMGKKLELESIERSEMYDKRLQKCSVEEFLNKSSSSDNEYAKTVNDAQKNGHVLRYVAKITPTTTTVGLIRVDQSSPIGRLKGPENIVVFRTKRYDQYPLVIQGPGAGVEVTAAGLLTDLINISYL